MRLISHFLVPSEFSPWVTFYDLFMTLQVYLNRVNPIMIISIIRIRMRLLISATYNIRDLGRHFFSNILQFEPLMVNFLFPLKVSTVLHKAYFIFWELASDGLQMFDIYKVEYIKQSYSHFAQRPILMVRLTSGNFGLFNSSEKLHKAYFLEP